MQIMPTFYSESLDNPYMNSTSYEGDSSFADEMARQQLARDAVDSGEAHSVEVALEPQSEPLTQAPYNPITNDGTTYTADEVFFTQQELDELRGELTKKGVSDDMLKEFDKLASQPDGATLHQVLSSFYNFREYASLSDGETATLKGLIGKIDPSGDLANSLFGHIHGTSGKDGNKFLNDLVAGMDKLPNGSRVEISKDEMAIIAKAAGLSEDATSKLLGSFGPFDSLQLNKQELSNFLSPAFNDFKGESEKRATLDKALDETLGTILSAARARMQKEEAAYALSLRTTEQSKLLIEKTVLENVNKNLEQARAGQMAAKDSEASMQARIVAEAQAAAKASDSKQMRASLDENSKSTMNMHTDKQNDLPVKGQNDVATKSQDNAALKGQSDMADAKFSANTKDKGFGEFFDKNSQNHTKSDSNLNSLLNKADVQTMANIPNNNITTPVVGIGGLNQGVFDASHAQAPTDLLSRQAASQVEHAMLQAAKDGTKRLDLQLHPMELGAVTITLTSRNGELNALIRSERPETTELMHRQLDQIRGALEQQGIKVDKLEVQTQTPENNAQYDQWDSMQEHNARQEENSRREVLERLRNLGKVRNDGINLDETTLEHSVQLDKHTAITAGQPLHIVA